MSRYQYYFNLLNLGTDTAWFKSGLKPRSLFWNLCAKSNFRRELFGEEKYSGETWTHLQMNEKFNDLCGNTQCSLGSRGHYSPKPYHCDLRPVYRLDEDVL